MCGIILDPDIDLTMEDVCKLARSDDGIVIAVGVELADESVAQLATLAPLVVELDRLDCGDIEIEEPGIYLVVKKEVVRLG